MGLRVLEDASTFERTDLQRIKNSVDLRYLLSQLTGSSKPISENKVLLIPCLNGHDRKTDSLAIWGQHATCFAGCPDLQQADVFDLAQRFLHLPDSTSFPDLIKETADWVGHRLSLPTPVVSKPFVPRDAEGQPVPIGEAWKIRLDRYHARLDEPQPDGTTKREWFLRRGLTNATIEDRHYGWNGKAFVIPVWDKERKFVCPRFRRDDSVDTDGPRYYGIKGHNEVLLYNQWQCGHPDYDSSTIVLCEGEFDADAVSQLIHPVSKKRISAVSLTNGMQAFKSGSPLLQLLSAYANPVVLFDANGGDVEKGTDAQSMARAAASFIGPHAKVAQWVVFDPTKRDDSGPTAKAGCKDPSELLVWGETSDVWRLIANAQSLDEVSLEGSPGNVLQGFWWNERGAEAPMDYRFKPLGGWVAPRYQKETRRGRK